MPRNLLGTSPSSNNLSIPRACIFISELAANDRPLGNWREVGSVASASIEFNINTIEHYGSCGEQRVKDAEATIEFGAELSMEIEHLLMVENLELILNSKTRDISTGALSWDEDRTGAIFLPNQLATNPLSDPFPLGRHYSLWAENDDPDYWIFAGVPPSGFQIDPTGLAAFAAPSWEASKGIYGVDPSKFSIELPVASQNDASGGGLVLPVNEYFTVNAAQGKIFMRRDTGLAGVLNSLGAANANSQYLALQLNYTGSTAVTTEPPTIFVLDALSTTDRAVAVRFEMQDIMYPGYRKVYEIHKVRLRPNGSLDLVSDGTSFSAATLSGTIEKPTWKDGTAGKVGFFDVREVKY